jgi:hypothetical protein
MLFATWEDQMVSIRQSTRSTLGILLVGGLLLGACGPGGGTPMSAEAPGTEVTAPGNPTAEPPAAPFVAETNGPRGFTATLAAPDVVSLSWEPVDGAVGYEVQTGDGEGGFTPIAALPPEATTFEDWMAPEEAALTYRIVTHDASGPTGASSLQITTQARTPQPLTVSPTYDEQSGVTGTIGPQGGTLEMTDGRGVTYTLRIPPGSLDEPTEITMVPVTSIDGWPLDGESLGAVRLEPEGTQLAAGATLLISGLPAGDPSLATVGTGFDGNGMEFHLWPVLGPAREEAARSGSGRLARPARQDSRSLLVGLSELAGYGVGQVSASLAGQLVKSSAPSDSASAAAQKQAAAQAVDELAPIPRSTGPTDPARREANAIASDMLSASGCDELKAVVDRATRWSQGQQAAIEYGMTDMSQAEFNARESRMVKNLVEQLVYQIDQISNDCVEDTARSSLGDIPCIQGMLARMSRGDSVFWQEANMELGKQRSEGGYGNNDLAGVSEALDGCRPSYRVLSVPHPEGSWESDCIPDLTEPYTLAWQAPRAFGRFRIMPSSSNSGRIFSQLHSEGEGTSFDITDAGRYTIGVLYTDDKGNPEELQLVYRTVGTGRSCAGDRCEEFPTEGGPAYIPIIVQPGLCPQE